MDRKVRDLAEEFVKRQAEDDKLTIDTWCEAHPDVSDELRRAIETITDPDATVQAQEVPAAEEDDYSQLPMFDSRYRVIKTLGEGGFGKVYLVADTFHHNEKLALKLIKVELQTTEAFTKRFQLEIRVLRALHHDGIPPIYNDGVTSDGEVYFTMAFVKGRSLQDIMREGKGLDPLDIANYVRQMVNILNYAHSQGVVHRDLKPGNVLITEEGSSKAKVLILDFGIAKVLKEEAAFEAPMTMQTEMPIGTPHYMAPEQVRGQEVDGKTDLYALGIMIYRMVAGGFPFKGNTSMEIMVARMHDKPVPLSGDTEPAWAARLVKDLLARQKENRPSIDQIRELITETKSGRRLQKQTMVIAVSALLGVVLLALRPWEFDKANTEMLQEEALDDTTAGTHSDLGSPGEDPVESKREDVAQAGSSTDPSLVKTDNDAGSSLSLSLSPVALGLRIFKSTPASFAGTLTGDHEGGIKINGKHVIVEEDGTFEASIDLEEGTTQVVIHDLQGHELLTEPVLIDLTDPQLALQVPDESILLGERSYRVLGRCSDNEGLAELTCDGLPVTMDDTGSFQFPVHFNSEGPHTAHFLASDRAGRQATSEVSFIVDWTAPTVTFDETPPTSTTTVSYGLSGLAIDSHGLTLMLNNDEVVVDSNGRFEVELPLVLGSNTFQLVATDDAGSTQKTTLRIERAEPVVLVPEGCTEVRGSGTLAGWARQVLHTRSGLALIYIPATTDHDAFYMGQTEVTRQQFSRIGDLPQKAASVDAGEDHPVTNITAPEAWVWCERAGVRLPTQQEWISAAGNSTYPWGANWDAGLCNSEDNQSPDTFAKTCPVDAMPEDLSNHGIIGMAGNVAEWCDPGLTAQHETYDGKDRAFLGGSFREGQSTCITNAIRGQSRVPKARSDIGFRVVLDTPN